MPAPRHNFNIRQAGAADKELNSPNLVSRPSPPATPTSTAARRVKTSTVAAGTPSGGHHVVQLRQRGRLKTTTNALGKTTSYTYDESSDQVDTVTDPMGHTTSFDSDDATGLLTAVTDADGHTTKTDMTATATRRR